MASPLDVLVNANSATVTAGGTTAPAAGTSESWTVTTTANFPVVSAALGTQFRVIDAADLGKTSGYEVMAVTASLNGAGVSWTVTRGAELTGGAAAPYAHAANWVCVPAPTAGGLTNLQSVLTASVANQAAIRQAALQAASRHGSTANNNIPTGIQNTTTVVAASNGVNINTFAGSGVLNVASTAMFTSPSGPRFGPSPQILQIQMGLPGTGTNLAQIAYTGTTATTFTGCTVLNSGAGLLGTGYQVYAAPVAVTDVVVCADSILYGEGSNITNAANIVGSAMSDWFTDVLAKENREAGLPDPGRGWRRCTSPFFAADTWSNLAAGAAMTSNVGPSVGATTASSWNNGAANAIIGDAFPFRRAIVHIQKQTNGAGVGVNFIGTVTATAVTNPGGGVGTLTFPLTTNWTQIAVGSTVTGAGITSGGLVTAINTGTGVVSISGTLTTLTTSAYTFFTPTADTNGSGIITIDSGDLGTYQTRTLQVKQLAAVSGSGAANLSVAGYLPMTSDGTTGVQGFNFGQSGATTTMWLSATGWNTYWLPFLQPRRIYMALGINDLNGGMSLATLQTNLTTLVQSAQAASPLSEIVLCVLWHAGNTVNAYNTGISYANWSTFVNTIATVALNTGCTLVDMSSWFGDGAVWTTAGCTTTNAGTSATVVAGGFPNVEVGMYVQGVGIPDFPNAVTVSSIVGNTINFAGNTAGIVAAGTPVTITGATNSGTTVTFAATNTFVAGQTVVVSGVTGFTTNNPNGTWTVLAAGLSGSHFEVVVSNAPTGTYGSGGAASNLVLTFTNDVLGISIGDGVHFGDAQHSTSGRDAQLGIADMMWNNLSYYVGSHPAAAGPGWTVGTGSWVRFASNVFTIFWASNLSNIYTKGTKLTWTESGVVKYGVVSGCAWSPSTGLNVVTMYATTDYAMAATPDIGSTWYSFDSPPNFPTSFGFTPTFTGATGGAGVGLWSFNNGMAVVNILLAGGTGSTTAFTCSNLPIATGGGISVAVGTAQDAGTECLAVANSSSGATTISFGKNVNGGAWTASGTRYVRITLTYEG